MCRFPLAVVLIAGCVFCTEAARTARLVSDQSNELDGMNGTVQVLINRTWSFINGRDWDLRDAIVACRDLGYKGLGSFDTVEVHITSQIISSLHCSGKERMLTDCDRLTSPPVNRNPASVPYTISVAAVSCTDFAPVRLVGGEYAHEGRVEVFYNGSWGSVCDDFWDDKDGDVVCKQLGYPGAIYTRGDALFGQGSSLEKIWLDDVNCTEQDFDIRLCKKPDWSTGTNCEHEEDASVVCKTPVNCPALPEISNGVMYTDGARVKFRCNHNFTLFGKSGLTCLYGRWNGVPPLCAPTALNRSRCFEPSIKNGRVSFLKPNQIKIDCDQGYTLLGHNIAQCFGYNVWNMLPTCLPTRGDQDGCRNRKSKLFPLNYTINFRNACRKFVLVGYSTISCVKSGDFGEWNGPFPQCIDPSRFVIRGNIGTASRQSSSHTVSIDMKAVTGGLLGVLGVAVFLVLVIIVAIIVLVTARRKKRTTQVEGQALTNLSAPLVNNSDGEEL